MPTLSHPSHHRAPRTTTDSIKRWYLKLKNQQRPATQHKIRDYFARHHLPWYPEMGSIVLALHPDAKRPYLAIPYVATPVPTAAIDDFQSLECRALSTVPSRYRRRCLGPKGIWQYPRPTHPLLITESITDSLAADQLFGPTLNLVALNSITNFALLPHLIHIVSPPKIILALDHDPHTSHGYRTELRLIDLLQPFNISISRLTLHHHLGYKDLHKVLIHHPNTRFTLTDHLIDAN